MIEILGEKYEEILSLDEVLWRGDLLIMDPSCGPDYKVYMLYIAENRKAFGLINYVGYKGGAQMDAVIPKEASSENAMNVRLHWLKDNWNDCIPIGSFESTKFFRWKSE